MKLAYTLTATASAAPSLAPLATFIAGRYAPDERATLYAQPVAPDAPAPAAPAAAAGSLPLVHILIPDTWDRLTDGLDGVALDRFGEEDGKPTTQTAQQRRPSSSSVLVPPLPLGKPEVVSSSSAAVRRKNSFVAKLVASWQFAQRKRLRRQGKEGERERVFFFCSLSFYLNSLALFPLFLNFSLFTHARALSLSPLQKNTHE